MRIKSYKRFSISLLILAAIGYLVFLGGQRFFQVDKTYKASYDTLDVEKACRAIVLRQETIVTANLSGKVEWFVKEGGKVQKTQRLASILVEDNKTLEKTNESQLTGVKAHEMLKVDIVKVDQDIELLRKDVYAASAQSNFKRLKELQRDLELKIERKKKLIESQNLLEDSVSSFQKTYLSANDIQVGKTIDLSSPESGIATFQTDGFEDTITLDNLYNLDYDLIFASKVNPGVWGKSEVLTGNPMVKIVDNSSWYLLCMIERDDMDSYEKNKEIGVNINDKIYLGKVADVFENNQKGVLVLKMTDLYDNFHQNRFLEVRVVRENYQGLKIQNGSIITLNGLQGVYVVGMDKKAVFRPIKILGNDDKNAIIKPGYITVIQNGESKRIKTVDLNSQVVINPVGVRPGDAIK